MANETHLSPACMKCEQVTGKATCFPEPCVFFHERNIEGTKAFNVAKLDRIRRGMNDQVHATGSGISDSELLARAVRGARANRSTGPHPRWVGVSDTFALGSTYSRELCRRYGLDPDEQVRRGRTT